MRTTAGVLIAVLLLAVQASSSIRVSETLLTSWGGSKHYPRMSGEQVVYDTNVSGTTDVMRVTVWGAGPFAIADSGSAEMSPVIDGDLVVYVDNAAGNDNLVLHDLSTGLSDQFTFSPAREFEPDISGLHVVYASTRSGDFDIYHYDIDSQMETPLASSRFLEVYPRIDGTLVVWQQYTQAGGGFNYDVYARYLDGPIFTVADSTIDEESPVVSGSLIAFVRDHDIALYDVETGITTDLTDTPQDEASPEIDGNWVAWMDDRTGDYDIYVHDLSTGETAQLTSDSSDQWLTDIEGNRVVFWDERAGYANIWMCEWAYNGLPVADAGPDQQVYTGNMVHLSGSGTDPDADPIEGWLWRMESRPAGSTAALSDTTIPNPTFTPDVGGNYVLSLVVSDDLDPGEPDTVVVESITPCPVPEALVDTYPTSGDAPLTVWFDASASYDPGGNDLYFRWAFGDGTPISHEAAVQHIYEDPGTWRATIALSNACGESTGLYIDIEVGDPGSGVADGGVFEFALQPSHPNPFNPRTTVSYSVPVPGAVELRVYDVRGSLVRTLVDEAVAAGLHAVTWDGRDDRGASVGSGVYFVRLSSRGDVRTQRVVLLE
jgi:beta propeller repeat protein